MSTVIVWFRRDLRIEDNPALRAASAAGRVLPVYILESNNDGWDAGEASLAWLDSALRSLNDSLDDSLRVVGGAPADVLADLAVDHDVSTVFFNRRYEPRDHERDNEIRDALSARNIEVKEYPGSLLWEPHHALKQDGTPYRVFTPFYKYCRANLEEPRQPQPAPENPEYIPRPEGEDIDKALDKLSLLPRTLHWHEGMLGHWDVSEAGAQARRDVFLESGLARYRKGRDFPASGHVSRLSPYLHFGQISPHQVWHDARIAGVDQGVESDMDHFLSELGWREFSHHLLWHFPDLPETNLQSKFDAFPWRHDSTLLECWQRGMTGYPIVDAGMRELWQTGYMHNRVRMIVGSFLVKNLLLHWHHGRDWFWDCLVDADLANNSASWQWIAGCGADAAPYFRVFNPVTQGEKFDAAGDYVRKYVPEIAALPDRYLHAPWTAPPMVTAETGVTLGRDYPVPVVDLKESRERALQAFQSIRNS